VRLILSRKGFDSESGGCPSPIFPDGSMFALPIPDPLSPIRYMDITWRGRDIGSLVSSLTRGRQRHDYRAHLDPDLRQEVLPREYGWRPTLGQNGVAQRHLEAQRVGPGDIFLFWGLFRRVDEGLNWRGPKEHRIWGWMQIGSVVSVDLEVRPRRTEWRWAERHPHLAVAPDEKNTLYLGTDNLTLPSGETIGAGYGTFDFVDLRRQLTATGGRGPVEWALPADFMPRGRRPLSYHRELTRWTDAGDRALLRAVSRGQEFVLDLDQYPGVFEWLRALLTPVGEREAQLPAPETLLAAGPSVRNNASATPRFHRYIGIDYSGAKTPTSSLPGLRAYVASDGSEPEEVQPPRSARKYWTRRGLTEWLIERLNEPIATLVGIDHAFSFPEEYFELHSLARDWPTFLADFQSHMPTDGDSVWVREARKDSARSGNAGWLRLTERRSGSAKSVFRFGVEGEVATSTHAGIPWLLQLRRAAGHVRYWPFDGWLPERGQSVVLEVYPRLWRSNETNLTLTPDQRDAHAAAHWLQTADRDGRLEQYFAPPLSDADRVQAEIEGWIFGVMEGVERKRKRGIARSVDLAPGGVVEAVLGAETEEQLLLRITEDPAIFGGKPIVRGRRVAVEHILQMLGAGDTFERIRVDFPWLERADLRACLAYAARAVRRTSVSAEP
jgi:uncharacterized protein (DUF433 family)